MLGPKEATHVVFAAAGPAIVVLHHAGVTPVRRRRLGDCRSTLDVCIGLSCDARVGEEQVGADPAARGLTDGEYPPVTPRSS